MLIKGNSLKYQFISIPSGKISDEWTIIKTARGSTPDQLIS
jgi:hypothetical protein